MNSTPLFQSKSEERRVKAQLGVEESEPRADYVRKVLSDVDSSQGLFWAVEQKDDGTVEIWPTAVFAGHRYTGTKWIIGELFGVEGILETAFHAVAALMNDMLRHRFEYKGQAIFKMQPIERKKFLEGK